MSRPETLEAAIAKALLEHADAAHLPLTQAHVRAQAAVARRAAQAWSAQTAVDPLPRLPELLVKTYQPKPRPADDDLPPDQPTPTGAHCSRPDCVPLEAAVGWRWYLAGGWQAVCARHMGGAPRETRRFNLEYLVDGAQ